MNDFHDSSFSARPSSPTSLAKDGLSGAKMGSTTPRPVAATAPSSDAPTKEKVANVTREVMTPALDPQREAIGAPAVSSDVVTRVLTSVAAIFGASTAPVSPLSATPLDWTMLAVARRQAGVEATDPKAENPASTTTQPRSAVVNATATSNAATNSAPVVDPTAPYALDPGQPGDYFGLQRGHVNATDPDGDPLTYSGSGDTTKGYAQIDYSTGAFKYLPTAQSTHAASATDAATTGANRDTFTVTVSDGKGGTVSVPVTVGITPMNTAPRVDGAPTVRYPDATTGEVRGTLNVVDDDGDTLSYDVGSAPARGQLTVGTDGSFVYTPTAAARQQAASTYGTDYDGFTVNVSDGHQGATTVTVNNAIIAPTPSTTPPMAGHIPVGSFPIDLTMSHDGKSLYVLDFNSNDISVIDTGSGTKRNTQTQVGLYPIALSLNPSGTAAYVSSSYLPTVDIVDTSTGAVTGTLQVGRHPAAISFSPDGKNAYVLNFTTGELQQYDTASNSLVGSVSTQGNRPMRMSLSADGSTAYVLNSTSNTVSVINTSTLSVLGSPIAVGRQDNYGHIALTPDGTKVYVSNAQDNNVTVIDTATRATQTIAVGANPMGVAVSPDGRTVYVTNGISDTLSVIDTASGTVTKTVDLGGGSYAPVSVAVSADGSEVYVGRTSYDGSGTGDVVVIGAGETSSV